MGVTPFSQPFIYGYKLGDKKAPLSQSDHVWEEW